MQSGNKDFYIRLLNSENLYDRLDGWNKVDYLLQEGIITKKEIISLINKFKELLYDKDVVIALHAVKLLDKLRQVGILDIDEEIKRRVKELVLKPTLDSWWVAEELLREGILSSADLSMKVEEFLEFLESPSVDQIDAWNLAKNLVREGVIDKESLKPYVTYILPLLKSDDMHLRFNSWLTASDLIKEGIADASDFMEARDYLMELLNSDYFEDLSRIYERYASDFLDIMKQVGIVKKPL